MLKRTFLFLLTVFLLASFSACGKAPATQPATQPVETPVTEPITLIENDALTLRVLKIEPEAEAGYAVSVMVWNKTDIAFLFVFDDFAVNDLLYGEDFQFEVEGGQKELKRITLTPDRMEMLGLGKVTKLDFQFYGIRTDTGSDAMSFQNDLSIYPLGEAAYKTHQRTPAQTDVVLLDNAYCTVTFLGSYASETDLLCSVFVTNKTDKELLILAKDLTLNGVRSDTYAQLSIPAGKQGYDTAFLPMDALREINIETIESFAAQVEIYDNAHYSDGPLTTESVSK